MRVLEPLPTSTLTLDDRDWLRDEARRRISEALPESGGAGHK
jgi:hypothetical protein